MFTNRWRYRYRFQGHTNFVFIKNIFKNEKEDGNDQQYASWENFLKTIICVYHNIASNRFYPSIVPRTPSSSSKISDFFLKIDTRRRRCGVVSIRFSPEAAVCKTKKLVQKTQKRQKICARRVAADYSKSIVFFWKPESGEVRFYHINYRIP